MEADDAERTSHAERIESAVAGLFPGFVAVAVEPSSAVWSPHEDEMSAVTRAVPRRRHEFLSGRACAHRALGALGLDRGAILVGAHREPIWPPGAVGAIAHAGGWSAAVAARDTDAWGLGVDVELLEPPLADDVDRLVRSPVERRQALPAGNPLAPHAAKLVFSAKESVYKALFPRTGWALEFDDVAIGLDLDGLRYTVSVGHRFASRRLQPPLWSAARALGPLTGGFRVVDGYLLSALWIPAGRCSLRSEGPLGPQRPS